MLESNNNFNLDNINSVELNLLNGQVELILRALELYGHNLEFMLNSYDDVTNDERQEKLAMLKYTYEQVIATQAEQVNGKENSSNNSLLGKNMQKNNNILNIIPGERKFNIV